MTKKVYTHEFRKNAVATYRGGEESHEIVAARLGIPRSTLATWVVKAAQSKKKITSMGDRKNGIRNNNETEKEPAILKYWHNYIEAKKKLLGHLNENF